jgi:predicted nuclease of restriction endonuclease-like (RecB) superfamily
MSKGKKMGAKTSRMTVRVAYDDVLVGIVDLLASARSASARTVNAIMTATYWEIGRRIVECEQGGASRAGYGEMLIRRLAADLTARFGRGFGRSNLFQIRAFYLAYADKVQTPSGLLEAGTSQAKVQTVSGLSASPVVQTPSAEPGLRVVAARFPLPWSHYVLLLSVKDPDARTFYQAEALRGGWSVRQLDRQISSQFFERTALSRNKAAMLRKGIKPLPEDAVTPEDQIKDPYVLEFLGLMDEYSENELEEALVRQLEGFLLELGGDFAFVGRQRRLRIDDEWYRVDLLFFHRRLRCLVVIDLKLGRLTHADAGQMHMYLNYAREHWMHPGENPPVGLILCAQKGAAMARYALEGLPNKVMAAEYRTALPDLKLLAAHIDKTRKAIETRGLELPERQKR